MCNARFLLCKDGAICAKNSPKGTSHGEARATIKLNSLRSPSPIMAAAINKPLEIFNVQSIREKYVRVH